MKNNGKISLIQFNIILIVTIPSTILLFIPADIFKDAKQDKWISFLLVGIYCIMFSIILTKLAKMYSGKNLIEICEAVLGLIPGKVIGFIFIAFFIHLNSVLLREFSDFLNGTLYYETPTWFFSLCILIPCVFLLYKGIETIARVGQFVLAIFNTSLVLILSLCLFDVDFSKNFPILANGFKPIFKGSMKLIIWVGEFSILLVFACFVENPKKLTKSVIYSIYIMGLLIIPISICGNSIFGSTTQYLNYPFLSLTRYISIARAVERIDTFILIMWVCSLFYKFAIFLYCGVQSAASLYKVKEKYFIIPIAVITLILSEVQWDSIMILKEKILSEYSIIYTVIQIGIPILIFIIAIFKKNLLKK